MKKNELEIRPYQISDEKSVIKLWQECKLIVPKNNPQLDIERKSEVNPELFLVGLYRSEIVATVMGGYEGHRGWINYLAVAKNHRRKGFGRMIMAEVEQKMIAIGCPKINLQIRAHNKKVIKFYESINYIDDNMVSMGKRFLDDSDSNPYI